MMSPGSRRGTYNICGKKVLLDHFGRVTKQTRLLNHGDIYQFINEVIDSLPCLDEEDDTTRFFEFRHHVFKGIGPDHFSAFGFIV